MKLVQSNKFSVFIIVDDADYELVSKFNWGIYGTNKYPRRSDNGDISLHEFLLGKTPKGLTIDHKDRNILNYQRENLRYATYSQNLANRRKPHGTSSAYKGVYYSKKRGYFIAQITVDGKPKYLGFFKSEEQAAKAYDIAAKRYYGEFAYQNFHGGVPLI
jgi:hypothetical protein